MTIFDDFGHFRPTGTSRDGSLDMSQGVPVRIHHYIGLLPMYWYMHIMCPNSDILQKWRFFIIFIDFWWFLMIFDENDKNYWNFLYSFVSSCYNMSSIYTYKQHSQFLIYTICHFSSFLSFFTLFHHFSHFLHFFTKTPKMWNMTFCHFDEIPTLAYNGYMRYTHLHYVIHWNHYIQNVNFYQYLWNTWNFM